MSHLRSWALALAALALLGCDDASEGEATPNAPAPAATVTWSGEIKALVEAECSRCHFEGGSAPFAFDTHANVAAFAPAMLDSMAAGRMPPWPADKSCRSYEGEPTLDADDVARFRAWVEDGAPEGAPSEPIVVVPEVFEPSVVARPAAAYTPDLSTAGDDYHCFLLDAEFAERTWITSSMVEPGSPAVHHVLVYALKGNQVAQAEALDASEPGEGYTCFGGPLPTSGEGGVMDGAGSSAFPIQVAAWVPGIEPRRMGEGVGLTVEPGSRLVMQMHYSAAGAAAEPDATAVLLQTTTTPPSQVFRTSPLAIPELDIPAGAADVQVSTVLRNWSDEPVPLVTFAGHMHLIGRRIEAVRVPAEGSDAAEECGLSIPDWDFDWQMSYDLGAQPLVLQPGEGLRLTCSYDNTQANQPFVDGEQIEPRDVAWGDGSLDEMCLVYTATVQDYEPPEAVMPGAPACASASECFAASDGSLSALLACEKTSAECATCALQAGVRCGLTPCLAPFVQDMKCVADCVLATNAFGGSLDRCMRGTCGEQYTALLACADPIAQNDCAEAWGGCGLATAQ